MVRLTRQRQRNEAEQVDDEDEEEERGHVGEPPVDRLRRQALLGDLYLRDLGDLLADRLPNSRGSAGETFTRIRKIPMKIVRTVASIR